MDATADELAGVVDLFGGLTRDELERALAEVAFRDDGQSLEHDVFDSAVDRALETFALVEYEHTGDTLLVAGPSAFPRTPEHAEDLPHILDIEPRHLDRDALGEAALERFRGAVDDAVAADDAERADALLDVSYDLEAWAPVSVDAERERLDDLL